MTGILLSDSTSILSTHHRSARENSSPAHPDYHPHPSHPCRRQPPLSSFSILPTHQSTPQSHPSPSSSTLCDMSDRPTLPGIANLLALAGQHRSALMPSPPSSHSHRTRSSQLSDPVAHALPAFIDVPPFPKNPPLANRPASPPPRERPTHPSHQGHRRRSSSITIVDAEKRSSSYSNRALQHPPQLQQIISTSPPSSKHLSSSNYPIPAPPTFRKICHESAHSYANDTYSPVSDRGVSSLQPCDSGASLHDIVNHTSSGHDDALRRRHSERTSAPLSRSIHRTSSRHNTPPPPQQPLVIHQPPHHPWTQSFTNAPLSPSQIIDQDDRHVRRRSNASVSSSSSISGSASLSSDFGTSLNTAAQAQVRFRGAHTASPPVNSMLSSFQDRTCPQYLKAERPWSNEEGGLDQGCNSPCSTLKDQRSFDCNRRWDPQESSSHYHNINMETCHQPYESRSQMSLSPEINSSSRLSGPSMGSVASCPQNHRYQCLEVGCGKTFSRPSSLKIHSYSHTGQKPFKCMRCDRAFSVQSNLKRHQKVHEKRSIAVYSRGIPGNGNTTSPMMAYESGSGLLIEEESGEEDGGHDRME